MGLAHQRDSAHDMTAQAGALALRVIFGEAGN